MGIATGSFGEDLETLAAFAEQTGVTFPIVWDDGGSYGDFAWPPALSPFPRQVVVGRDGRVRYLASEHRADELALAIEAALLE